MSSFHNFCLSHNGNTEHMQIDNMTNLEENKKQISSGNPTDEAVAKGFRVVETNLEEQHSRIRLKKHTSMFEENDSDIEDFLEEEDLIRYRAPEYEEESEQEEEEYSMVYSTSSTLPPYLTMSRIQKKSYFDRLNSDYLNKMIEGVSSLNLNSNSDKYISSQTKRKPAIKFNDVVYEVPFGKEDQPKIVGHSYQEETYIKFDDAAYEIDSEEQSQSEQEVENHQFQTNGGKDYFDELDEFDFEQNLKNTIFVPEEKQDNEESMKEEKEKFLQNHEPSFSLSPKIREDIHLEQLAFDGEEEEICSFKRDSNGKFLAETSTSSDSNSSDSSSSEWKQAEYNEEFESYFALFLNGRKINPNALHDQCQAETQN